MKVSSSVFVDFSPHIGRYVLDYTLSSTWMEGDDGLSRWNMNCRRYVGFFLKAGSIYFTPPFFLSLLFVLRSGGKVRLLSDYSTVLRVASFGVYFSIYLKNRKC